MWPSDLALKALRAAPNTTLRWGGAHAGTCSHCGKPIEHDAPYSPVQVGVYFSDTRDLASPSGLVCGGCEVLRSKRAMNALSFVVLTPDGVFPIAKDIHKAWLFLTPPEPPFVAVHTSATMQHLVWRTPVSLSREHFFLRRGADLFTLRPGMLVQSQDLAAQIQARRVAAGDPKAPLSPYRRLDRSLRDSAHGALARKAQAAMSDNEIMHFRRLTIGETWALTFLLTSKPPVPTRPDRLEISL